MPDLASVLEQARVPEHSAPFMQAMSQGTAFLEGEYLFLTADDWLMAIGYPLSGEYAHDSFERALAAALRRVPKRLEGAAAVSPALVVLDEPSSNLDFEAIAQLRSAIARWKAEGVAVLVAEHRIHYLEGIADHVLYLDDGRLARQWTADEFARLDDSERMHNYDFYSQFQQQ